MIRTVLSTQVKEVKMLYDSECLCVCVCVCESLCVYACVCKSAKSFRQKNDKGKIKFSNFFLWGLNFKSEMDFKVLVAAVVCGPRSGGNGVIVCQWNYGAVYGVCVCVFVCVCQMLNTGKSTASD